MTLLLKCLLVSVETADITKALGVTAIWKQYTDYRAGQRSSSVPRRFKCCCVMKSKENEKKNQNCPFDVFDLGSACVPLSAL